MLTTSLVLLFIGTISIWGGIKLADEILRIAAVVSGAILSILGFILAPFLVKFLLMLPLIILVLKMDKFDAAQPKF